MVESYQRRSALSHFGLAARASQGGHATAGVILGESAHRTIVNIRGNSSDPAFVAAVKSATGVDLPVKANTVNAHGDTSILWLGPTGSWVVTAAALSFACTKKAAQRLKYFPQPVASSAYSTPAIRLPRPT